MQDIFFIRHFFQAMEKNAGDQLDHTKISPFLVTDTGPSHAIFRLIFMQSPALQGEFQEKNMKELKLVRLFQHSRAINVNTDYSL